MANQFGEQLEKRVPGWASEYPSLLAVQKHLGKPITKIGLEETWTCIDYHAKFPGTFTIDWVPRGQVVRELKASLLRLYGSSCDDLAEELPLSDKYTLGNMLGQMRSGDTVVSFNYDTLVERLFQKRGDLKLLHCSGLPPEGVVRLAKPHGSTSWDLRYLSRRISDGQPLVASLSDSDVLKEKADPLLLGAVPIKSELIAEVQFYFKTPRVYEVVAGHWRAVADAVRDADRLVVLGYSFPSEDAYGRFFLREAMRERNKRLLKVEVYDLLQKEKEIKCSICEALGDGLPVEIHYIGEVTPAKPIP